MYSRENYEASVAWSTSTGTAVLVIIAHAAETVLRDGFQASNFENISAVPALVVNPSGRLNKYWRRERYADFALNSLQGVQQCHNLQAAYTPSYCIHEHIFTLVIAIRMI